jgi:cobalt/nickel transport system ATP-binding protein
MDSKKIDITVKNLSYKYHNGQQALNNISFEVYAGENVALVGPNGAGKTTLLLHLNGLIQNNNGCITIDGAVLNKKNIYDLRKKIGIVFQDPDDQLFMSTVFDDVAFGPLNMSLSKDEVKQRVRMALHKMDVDDFENRCPHHLSFGEKKKVSIATILSMTPDIFLLDEPTANLDPAGRRNMINTLRSLNSTKIIASHDIEMLLELCDKAILMNAGKIVVVGETTKILTDEKLLKSNGLEAPLSVKALGKKVISMLKKNGD